jgi:hypothetical protein
MSSQNEKSLVGEFRKTALSLVMLFGIILFFPSVMILLIMAYTKLISIPLAIIITFFLLLFYGIILYSIYVVMENYLVLFKNFLEESV